MYLGIDGKHALITGGSHGIGLATATALAKESCNVAICARTESRLVEAEELLRGLGVDVIAIPGDVTKPQDIDRIMDTVVLRWGTIDILINNVGGGGRWGSPRVEETSQEVWSEVYDKNATAAVRFTMCAIPHMRKQKWGRVVTVTSRLGIEGGGRPWFNMAKSAQTSLMKTLAMTNYLARDGITFNSVAPGSIMIPDTGWATQQQQDPDQFSAMLDEEFPLGRLGTPEEVADVILFICSIKASYLNGAAVMVDGAESRRF